MLLCADEEAATAALASGMLACPSCRSGRLRSWGWGRERAIRVPGGDAAAASTPGQVPVLRRDARPASGLDGAPARRQHGAFKDGLLDSAAQDSGPVCPPSP
jgi:hypothetical protein